jgi:hypothetical protein
LFGSRHEIAQYDRNASELRDARGRAPRHQRDPAMGRSTSHDDLSRAARSLARAPSAEAMPGRRRGHASRVRSIGRPVASPTTTGAMSPGDQAERTAPSTSVRFR